MSVARPFVRRCPRCHIAATLLPYALALALAPTAAPAQPRRPTAPQPAPPPRPKTLSETLPPDVKVEYEAGRILFQDGDYATALLKFQSAYGKTNEPRLLWNIAACQKNLRHYAKALDLIRRYLADGGALLTAEDRREADELTKAIEPFTTTVTFKVSEDGAEITLDDEPLGTSPITRSIVVDIGGRRVRAKKAGFRTFDKEIPVGGSKNAVLEVKLEHEGGHLELRVPSNATVSIDDKEIGRGPVVSVDLSIGGHALRIAAPKMRMYQGEVVIEDGKTRNLDIQLEPDLEQVAELRVAVGCRDPEVRTPEQGLVVFLDDSPESASPLGVRKRTEDGHDVVAYVPFAVTPGPHTARVRLPGCETLAVSTVADPRKPGVAMGMLPPENPWFNGSPAGSPNGWRVSAGLYTSTTTFARFHNLFDPSAGRALSSYPSVDLALAGPSATFGLQSRWFTALIEARYLFGSTSGTTPGVTYPAGAPPVVGTISNEASFSLFALGARVGPRIPLYLAALSGGFAASSGRLAISQPNGWSDSSFLGTFGAWAAIDAQPLCDWGIQGGFEYSAVGSGKQDAVGAKTATAFFLHAVYAPNVLCSRKRGGLYRLDGGAR